MKQANVFMLVTAVFCVVGVFIGQCQKAVAQQPKGMQWVLRQMDQDDDGAISRSEAKGR
ncbi:MAG: hypothetical protein HOH16_05005, partial [Planctomycetaceae bacterium]|nr:hypothetical protein [Planctomycetaceae bacterium]